LKMTSRLAYFAFIFGNNFTVHISSLLHFGKHLATSRRVAQKLNKEKIASQEIRVVFIIFC